MDEVIADYSALAAWLQPKRFMIIIIATKTRPAKASPHPCDLSTRARPYPPGDWTRAFRRDSLGRVAGITIGCWLARGLPYQRVA
jgi:hypothetical protein